jgi:hypothetical protein
MLEGTPMSKVRRVLSVVCLLLFLGLPLAAQTERETVSPFARFLEAFWAKVSAPLAPITAIWQADGDDGEDPDPAPTPGGAIWDPLG